MTVVSMDLMANTGPAERKKPEKKQTVENTVPEKESGKDVEEMVDEDQVAEEEKPAITNSSFNYLFYLIYKVKFAEVFRFPESSTLDQGISIHRVNLNAVIERLVNPRF